MSSKREYRRCMLFGTAWVAALSSVWTGAAAETSADDGTSIAEVVVTAQKRSEPLQSVPISILSKSADQLEASNVQSVFDLPTITPGFTLTRTSQASAVRLNLRGLGSPSSSAVESSIGVVVDDIYIPRSAAILSSFLDVDQVEILRGPQGTLFGRNTTAGAMMFRSAAPTNEFGGYAKVEGGNFGKGEGQFAVNLPVNDQLAFRVAGIASRYDGWGRTLVGDHDIGGRSTYGGRISMRAEFTDWLRWDLKGSYIYQNGDGMPVTSVVSSTVTPQAAANFKARLGNNIPILFDEFSTTVNNYEQGALNDRLTSISSNLQMDAGGGYSLALIGGYNKWADLTDDADNFFLPFLSLGRHGGYNSESESVELQLKSPERGLLNGHFDFVGGLYDFAETYQILQDFTVYPEFCTNLLPLVSAALVSGCNTATSANDATSDSTFRQVTHSWAAYGQGTYHLTEALSAVLGARFTDESKTGSVHVVNGAPVAALFGAPENTNGLRYHAMRPTWRGDINYKATPDVLLFTTVSTGFKSGGFNSGVGASALNQNRTLRAETVTDYEVGAKTSWFDRALTVNTTLFRMDIAGLQDRTALGLGFVIGNAGNLRQQGIETEITARATRDLQFDFSAAYLDSEFTYYPNASNLPALSGTQNLAGQRNNYSPKWQGDFGTQYGHEVGGGYRLSLRADVSFISAMNIGGVTNADPTTVQDGYTLLSSTLKLTSPNDRWSVSAYAANLTDKGYCTAYVVQGFATQLGLNNPATNGTVQRCTQGEPRTFGLRAGVKF